MKITIHDSSLYAGKFGFIAQVIVMTFASILADWILPGVSFDTLFSAIITALVIALLNNFIRPILIVIAIPFMLFSMGLFLFIINAFIVWLASGMVGAFHVEGFGNAILFSLLLTLFNYLLEIPNRAMRHPKFSNPDEDANVVVTHDTNDDFQDCEEVKEDYD